LLHQPAPQHDDEQNGPSQLPYVATPTRHLLLFAQLLVKLTAERGNLPASDIVSASGPLKPTQASPLQLAVLAQLQQLQDTSQCVPTTTALLPNIRSMYADILRSALLLVKLASLVNVKSGVVNLLWLTVGRTSDIIETYHNNANQPQVTCSSTAVSDSVRQHQEEQHLSLLLLQQLTQVLRQFVKEPQAELQTMMGCGLLEKLLHVADPVQLQTLVDEVICLGKTWHAGSRIADYISIGIADGLPSS